VAVMLELLKNISLVMLDFMRRNWAFVVVEVDSKNLRLCMN